MDRKEMKQKWRDRVALYQGKTLTELRKDEKEAHKAAVLEAGEKAAQLLQEHLASSIIYKSKAVHYIARMQRDYNKKTRDLTMLVEYYDPARTKSVRELYEEYGVSPTAIMQKYGFTVSLNLTSEYPVQHRNYMHF